MHDIIMSVPQCTAGVAVSVVIRFRIPVPVRLPLTGNPATADRGPLTAQISHIGKSFSPVHTYK